MKLGLANQSQAKGLNVTEGADDEGRGKLDKEEQYRCRCEESTESNIMEASHHFSFLINN